MSQIDTLYLVGSPGTNKVMHGELMRLSRRGLSRTIPVGKKHGSGALDYPFDADLAELAIRYHRTSTQVLWGLYESQANRLEPLYDELSHDVATDGRSWPKLGQRFSVHASNVGGFAAGERQIIGTVKNALIDGASKQGVKLEVDAENPDWWIRVRMHGDTVWVGLDFVGRSLSHHGYRLKRGAAPLREHLAAVLLMLARYDARHDILIEPMCGAGTIAIEAALMATAEPRFDKPSALDRLPERSDIATTGPLFADTVPVILGSEIDPSTLRKAKQNANTAGVANRITWHEGHFRKLTPNLVDDSLAGRRLSKGLIIANPPYGHRLQDQDVESIYRELYEWTRQFSGWRAAFLVANPEFERRFGRPRIKKPLSNASIPAYFYLYEL